MNKFDTIVESILQEQSSPPKTDSKTEKKQFWRDKKKAAHSHMKRAKATGNGGWVKMLKKRLAKYDSHLKENADMTDAEVGQIMSSLNGILGGGTAQGETFGNALNAKSTSMTGSNLTKTTPEMQQLIQSILAKIPPAKLAEYQKNPAKFGAINASSTQLNLPNSPQ